jgi:RNA polymerase sigma-70 factor (ECF subfamily)
MAAVTSGDLQALVEVLAPEVVLIADGGGLVRAARRPLVGAETVLAFLARVADLSELVATTARFNDMPGARFVVDGDVTAVSLVIENDRITRIYAIRNPDKLGRLEEVAELRR